MTADTARASTQPAPLGKPGGPGLFHKKGQGLPVYIENIRNALIRQGKDESTATAMAIASVKKLAALSKDPAVKAAAAKALLEWEKAKAGAHVHASVDRSGRVVDMSYDVNLSRTPSRPGSAGYIYTHGWHLKGPSAAESKEAKHIVETNNEGAGMDVHTSSYFHYVANPTPGTTAVRNEHGSIVGVHSEDLANQEKAHRLKAEAHLAKAKSASEPELKDAHEKAASEHLRAAGVKQAYGNYYAQQYLLGAKGVEDVAPEDLKTTMYGSGKSFSELHHAADKADATAAEHLDHANTLVSRRKRVEATKESAKSMTDDELQSNIDKLKESKYGDADYDYGGGNFLALMDEKRARNEKTYKATKARNDAIFKQGKSEAAFTPAEEEIIKSASSQTKALSDSKLSSMSAAAQKGTTRKHQLQAEAINREIAKRAGGKKASSSSDLSGMSEDSLATTYGRLSQRGAVATGDTRAQQKDLITKELAKRGLKPMPDPSARGKWTTMPIKKGKK